MSLGRLVATSQDEVIAKTHCHFAVQAVHSCLSAQIVLYNLYTIIKQNLSLSGTVRKPRTDY